MADATLSQYVTMCHTISPHNFALCYGEAGPYRFIEPTDPPPQMVFDRLSHSSEIHCDCQQTDQQNDHRSRPIPTGHYARTA